MTTDELRMRRKIQQLGSSTLAVTLPAEWARTQGIQKGEKITIQRDEINGSLLLVPDNPKTTDRSVTVDATSLTSEALKRVILAQYILGKNQIRIEHDKILPTELLETVKQTETQVMGLGTIEQSRSNVDIRCSVAPSDFELPELLERLWRTESMIRNDVVAAFLDHENNDTDRARHYKPQAEKLFSLFLRLLFTTYRNPQLNQTMGLETGFPLIGYRSIAQDIMLIIDCSYHIIQLLEGDEQVDEETLSRFESLTNTVDAAVTKTGTAVIEPSIESSEAASETVRQLKFEIAEIQQYLQTERPSPVLKLQRILSEFENIERHVRDSIEVTTHIAAREVSDADNYTNDVRNK